MNKTHNRAGLKEEATWKKKIKNLKLLMAVSRMRKLVLFYLLIKEE
ncbi:hypothetical protein HMPREF3215_00131 [Staphylococcus simulans]|nr:hypothetical protein HMPREF3215_00131 [Staphylococcus simulans]